MKIRYISVLAKIIIGFLSVFIVLYAIAYKTMSLLTKNIEKELRRNQTMQIEAGISDFESQLESIHVQMRRINNDPELDSFLLNAKLTSDYSNVSYINNLTSRLYNMKDTAPLIQNVRIFFAPMRRLVQAQADSYQEAETEEFQALLEGCPQGSLNDIHLVIGDAIHYVTVRYLHVNGQRELLYMMDVELSDAQLQAQIAKVASIVNGHGGLMHDAQKFYYTTEADMPDIGFELIETAMQAIENGDTKALQVWEYTDFILFTDSLSALESNIGVYYSKSLLDGILRNYHIRLILFSLISVLFGAYVCILLYGLLSKAIKKLVAAFRAVEDGDLSVRIEPRRNDEFSYMFQRFNSMVERLRFLIEQDYHQRILMQKAELKQLQYQINPHFLYNSLFQIKLMAGEEDYKSIENLAGHLGEYYRYIAKANLTQISLCAEVDHVRNYIQIQSIRFRGRYNIHIDTLPLGAEGLRVPRLIMQPIVENAFEHGLKHVEKGSLRIGMTFQAPVFEAVFEDSGAFIPDENIRMLQEYIEQDESMDSIASCTGIVNVHKRLRFFFGSQSGIRMERSDLGGLKVILYIDFFDHGENV